MDEKLQLAKRFEDLWIWRETRILIKNIYKDFNNSSGSRDFSFRDQIQRAGISVMNNIAEGFERKTNTEFARFLDISKGSCGEVRSMYYAAEDLGYVNSDIAESRRTTTKKIAAGITSFKKHLYNKSPVLCIGSPTLDFHIEKHPLYFRWFQDFSFNLL